MPIGALSEVYWKPMVNFWGKSGDRKAYALDWGTGRLNGVLDESVHRGTHLWLTVLTSANDGTAYAANTSPVFASLKKQQLYQSRSLKLIESVVGKMINQIEEGMCPQW